MSARVIGLFVSQGGVPKLPVDTLSVTITGCLGDKQNDLKHHGGPDKAVCILQNCIIENLQSKGHPIMPGSTGENLLLDGCDIGEIYPGSIIKFEQLEIEITQDAPPCKTISNSFTDGNFNLISHRKYPQFTRWYGKVIKEGKLNIDEEFEIIN
jgi:MOSC domain-containing protein YiiM